MDKSSASSGSARAFVTSRYQDGLEEHKSNPDRVFYDGEDLKDLDPNLVVLSTEQHENPRSWARKTKWTVTILTGVYCFLAPFSSTIFAPSLDSMMEDIGETREILGALQVALFLLAFAIAPIFLAPISEMYGRMVVLRSGNFVFAMFSLGAGFSQTTAQLSACRFFAGVGGASSLAVFGGILSDIWSLKDRARASSLLGVTLLMGPVIGPACGGWISERASWRWTCWVPAITAAVLEIVVTFLFDESYAPTVLRRKLRQNRKQQPSSELYTVLDLPVAKDAKGSTAKVIEGAIRPVMYLMLDPALLLLSLYFAFIFGVLYLMIVTVPQLKARGYGHSPGIVGIDMLSVGIGSLAGMYATAFILGHIYKRQVKKTEYKSESRLLSAFPGAAFVSAGLFMYGFTALKAHFMVPLVGILIFSVGLTNIYLAIQLYIIDSFDYPASAIAGLSVLRCLFAAVFPLFGHRLVEDLGVDWGMGLLGFLSLGLGVPFLPLIYFYGPHLRAMGKRNRERLFG